MPSSIASSVPRATTENTGLANAMCHAHGNRSGYVSAQRDGLRVERGSYTSLMSSPQPGDCVANYELVRLLGRGAAGAVFEGLHRETGARRAVKLTLSSLDLEELARCEREGEALGRVVHPALLRVHAAGVEAGRFFLVTELAAGGSLQDRISRETLSPDQAREFFAEIAQGLALVHQAGITHRDIKPANILLTAEGRPKLADFGLARLNDRSRLTETGTLLGTPIYMAPEQAAGGGVGPAADVYSLAATLYCALAGRPPSMPAQGSGRRCAESARRLPLRWKRSSQGSSARWPRSWLLPWTRIRSAVRAPPSSRLSSTPPQTAPNLPQAASPWSRSLLSPSWRLFSSGSRARLLAPWIRPRRARRRGRARRRAHLRLKPNSDTTRASSQSSRRVASEIPRRWTSSVSPAELRSRRLAAGSTNSSVGLAWRSSTMRLPWRRGPLPWRAWGGPGFSAGSETSRARSPISISSSLRRDSSRSRSVRPDSCGSACSSV